MFDLKRPCKDCPFRSDIPAYLTPLRIVEIASAQAFQCHKTVDYSEDTPAPGERPQQCAGLMSVLHKSRRPNAIMQIAERLGSWSPDNLDKNAKTYDSIEDAILAAGGNPDAMLPNWLKAVPTEQK